MGQLTQTTAEVQTILDAHSTITVATNFAGLPASPVDGAQVLMKSLNWTVIWNDTDSKWYNAFGTEVTVDDEA